MGDYIGDYYTGAGSLSGGCRDHHGPGLIAFKGF